MKTLLLILSLITLYQGRVVDQNGQPIPYATVYPEAQPEVGTATNNDGFFAFQADLPEHSEVIFSFIGYEKQTMPLVLLRANDSLVSTITLKEQPIALEETVVAAKASKQRNKRKQMAALLHAVFVKLEEEFPDENAQYQVVSDVRMLSEGSTWGMEQMIANIVVMPEQCRDGRDSVQFQGRFCKRFFDAQKRAQADSILASDALEHMEKQSKTFQTLEHIDKKTHSHLNLPQNFMRKAANAVDSGVVVHRMLFAKGNMLNDFQETMNDIKHWTVSNESEDETVLTHTQTVSKYLGLFKINFQRHYIFNSRTYAVARFSEHAEVKITIPFGYKLNADQLQVLNLINMDTQSIEKLRLKKMHGTIDYNTLYQRRNGKVYILEKNMLCNSYILGNKKRAIPILVKATQRITDLQTKDVQPLKKEQITRRMKREIVEIE